jgi:hypothetical protein
MNAQSKSFPRRQALAPVLALGSVVLKLLTPLSPAEGQASPQAIRAEDNYRECLYSKAKNRGYAKGARDSDFALIGECRNQWVAYMDACSKLGFDNETCVLRSRLLIHAILEVVGK